MQTIYDSVVALTDSFCRDFLNAEHHDFVRSMAAALCRKRPPSASGQLHSWACGIVHTLGQLNMPEPHPLCSVDRTCQRKMRGHTR